MLATDGLTNLVTSLGTDKDKSRASGWLVNHRTPESFEQIYRASAFGRKIIDIPTADMMRQWRAWSAEPEFIAAMEAAEKKYRIKQVVAKAHRFSRLYGSSAIIIGAAQRLGLSSDPLLIDKVGPGDLVYLHVDIYPRLQVHSWDTDISSPTFGCPRTYLYQPVARGSAGGQVTIDASRVIPFCGVPLPLIAAQTAIGWGDSVFTALEDVLTTAGTTTAVIASMLHEAKQDIIKTDLSGVGTPDGEDRVRRRFALAAYLKSVNNMLLLGTDESYEQKTLSFSGLPDIHIRMLQELSGAADIPVTRLLGQAPAGLQSTGESDLRNYYDSLASKQEDEIREPLERLDALLIRSEGIAPDPDAFFWFNSLWQESATQKAENALKRAQAAEKIVGTGLIPDVVMRPALVSQLVEAGDYPGLEAAMKEFEEEGEPGEFEDDPTEERPDAAKAAEGDDAQARRSRLRVVGDAEPRTLYISRKVENAAEILTWAEQQGFTNTVKASDLHVTVAFSKVPVDWFKVGVDYEEKVVIPRGGPRQMERFGQATVILFANWSLQWRHEAIREAGASWDYESYQPHITIALNAEGPELANVKPYQGKIVLGPEVFAEIGAGDGEDGA